MKKIKVASLLLVVVLLTGCPTEQPMGTEGPKSPAVEKNISGGSRRCSSRRP